MNTTLLAGLAALALATQAGAAHAQQRQSKLTGEALVKLCTSDPKSVEGCDAYIDGVADSAYFYQVLRPINGSKGQPLPGYICIPPAVTGGQLRETVVQFVQKRGTEGPREAAGVVLRALNEAYKCPANNPAPKP